jgi:tRNA (cmo5U34)-methyltransferase
MAQFHWDAGGYLDLIRQEVPDYEELQREVAVATGDGVREVLELGTGTGQSTRAVLARHPGARVTGIDASADMLALARTELPGERVDLREGRLEDPLPAGPFDVVVSVLAVHHLDPAGKADLFRRAAAALAPGGRLVVGDVVVPEDPADAVTPVEPGFDRPDTVADQLRWLEQAGLRAEVAWRRRDLAVLVGVAPPAARA